MNKIIFGILLALALSLEASADTLDDDYAEAEIDHLRRLVEMGYHPDEICEPLDDGHHDCSYDDRVLPKTKCDFHYPYVADGKTWDGVSCCFTFITVNVSPWDGSTSTDTNTTCLQRPYGW